MNPSPGSGRNDVVLAITSIVAGVAPAECTDLDRADAARGVAIRMVSAGIPATDGRSTGCWVSSDYSMHLDGRYEGGMTR
jgi:hypothetical protein